MKQLVIFLTGLILLSCQKEGKVDPPSTEILFNVSYGSDSLQKMDVYLPAGRNSETKLIVLVHGGGWTGGDKADFNLFVTKIQQRLPDYAIANINYRLAKNAANKFPAQENDMKAAIEFLVQKSTSYKTSQKIVLMGASAGAHLSLLQAYKYSTPPIKAVIDIFGPSDLTELYNYSALVPSWQLELKNTMGGTPSTNPSIYHQSSPINFVTAQSPPTIILHGDKDVLVTISHSIALKNKLQSLGVVHQFITYPGQGHGFWPDSVMNDAFDKIEAFLLANVK